MREGCTLRAAVCSACCPLQLQLHSPEALSSGEKFDSPNPRREISGGMFWERAPLHSNPFGEVFTPKQPCEIGEFLQLSTQDVGPYVDAKFIMFIFQAVTVVRGEALPEELSAKLLASWSS